jgi:hypothetical protein
MTIGGAREWGAGWLTRFWFQRGAGGKLTRIESANLALEVCPNLLGTITSLVHKPTGKELLTGRFPLNEWHSGMQAMEWFLPEVAPRRLVMEQRIQTHNWYHMGDKLRYYRTLELEEQAPALTIRRRFVSDEISSAAPGMPATSSFPTTWTLLVSEPDKASLTVSVRGMTHSLSLAAKGNLEVPLLETPEAGAQPAAAEEPDLDAVITDAAGPGAVEKVDVLLERGDGLTVHLATPVAGWLKMTAAADPETKTVSITLHGAPTLMKRAAHQLDLPGWRLEVR